MVAFVFNVGQKFLQMFVLAKKKGLNLKYAQLGEDRKSNVVSYDR